MTTQRRTLVVDDEQLELLRTPRDGILLERPVGPDRWELAEGPFDAYVRTLSVESGIDGNHAVVEEHEWSLAIPIWWVIYWLPIREHFRRGTRTRSPWWAPAGRLDARAARVIGLLGVLALVNGYLGTVIGQTLTFAADEFCGEFEVVDGLRSCIDPNADESARADIFSIVRIAVILSLGLTVAADRVGRRSAIRAAVIASCAATALGALAPGLGTVTLTQIVARGLATGLAILITVFAAEELPPRSRAYGASMLVLLAGLGSGMVVWVLPSAGIADWGWRIVYAIAALFLPVAWWAATQLPTTRRFAHTTRSTISASLRELAQNDKWRKRLLLLGAAALFGTIFSQPASQFDNDFLKNELGFTAARISLFTVVTSTPVGLGVLAGGMLADRIGRRPVGAVGVAIGTVMTLWSFFADEPSIWFIRTAGTILGSGIAIPALAVYGPELFPTRLRGAANGLVITFGVTGTVIGLQIVGRLAERWDAFGPALALVAIGPAIVVGLIVMLFPETAALTLEELNDEAPLGDS
ncbi:MAG: MFS transporter [Acidimicrobiales bacterium]